MKEYLVVLVTAHLLADFVLQSDEMVTGKETNRPGAFAAHGAIQAAVVGLALGNWRYAPVALAIGLSHVLIDLGRMLLLRLLKGKVLWSLARGRVALFTFDQLLHLGVLLFAAGWCARAPAPPPSFWFEWLGAGYWSGCILVAGFILTVWGGAILIGWLTEPLRSGQDEAGIAGAGRIIGQLERSLIFLLVATGNLAAVGFLTAAKSIFRLPEISKPEHRREVEYIMIGTLMSFTWAIAVALLARALAAGAVP